MSDISFRQALAFWLKLGFISFGGPAGQIAILHQELVERRRWISERRFLHALNYCMLLPGPEAQQLATYMGWLMHGTKGGIVAGVLFVAPSLVILIALSWAYMAFGHVPWVTAILYGIKPVVLALVIHAAHRMGSKTLHTPWLAGLSLVSFGAMVMGLPFPLIVLTAALAGWCLGKFKPLALGASTQAKPVQDKWSGETEQAPIWLDDDTPPMPHTRFSWSGLGKVMLVGLALCAVPLLTLSATLGWQHAYSQMAWFFTKAALLTFGGAYAVLPYVAQGAITHYAWITPMQMMDGLALGESTPGPLIMVVTFVGFVGAYTHQLLGPNAPALAGIAAACLVTWFTFLPSFVLIFAGAPLIETTHGRMAFTGPLTAISAAVVGVIAHLALFFAYNILWPNGWGVSIDISATIMTVASLWALIRLKAHVIPVIAAGGLMGLLVQWGRPLLFP
jgi:chromate transporter